MTTPDVQQPWWKGVPRYAWIVLIISSLGWLFDTMDQNLFNMVRQPSMMALLGPDGTKEEATRLGGYMTSTFLIGWAVGGFLFGAIGDKFGRAKTMAATILIYAVFTGLNGFVTNPLQYGFCRFMTALGVGGEFAAGAALVAEVFPARSRAMALGVLQALSAVGNAMAAVITLFLSSIGPDYWRTAFFVGAFPAVLVFVIRRVVKEPETWAESKAKSEREGLSTGSILALFKDPTLRRNTIAGTLLAIAGVGALWGVGFWLMDLVGFVSPLKGKELAHFKSYLSMTQQAGAFIGMLAFTAISERVGRRPALIGAFILAFFAIQGTFRFLDGTSTSYIWAFILGLFTLAPFAAYAVYFPELFPTRLRATGIGFCYNCARIIAAAAPLVLGQLAKSMETGVPGSGFRAAACVVAFIYVVGFVGIALAPETRGKPLPE
jgi:MFS family permease